ncbi:DUF4145 domain-containing protein [Aeromicrobium sp. CnD17-E]|uniref:DUF4145 domain-containing protein n=1 Tax=Aeromicrobium sp. CnD17-E TaxID=2954487 RepID=UPI0020972FFF|nr:DUF4145 domain-containing protein [Aeromicrobium sp. CnD17-E]MCO7238774.1 DUF4145 domain-containing protein [Aeromicrobium sp. CnD17-E]
MANNFDCPRCEARTQYITQAVGSAKNQNAFYAEPAVNAYLQCTSCTFVFGGVLDAYSHTKVLDWWPRRIVSQTFEDVPDHIASAASEAYVCLGAGAYRAAGAMARAVVEATAKDKKIVKGQIYDKVESMYEMRLIREHIRDAAHEVRHFGNDMAHGDFVNDVTEAEAEATLELMAEVLNEVYQSPRRVEKRREARLAKKDAVG